MDSSGYLDRVDAPTWAFIRATEAQYPPDATLLDIAGQRRVYDAMCAVFRQPRPPGVTVWDEDRAGVPTRRYETGASALTVVYFHGGGLVVGGLDSHDDVCAEVCSETGLRVVSVDYRLLPEHPHPAAYEDALAATRAVAQAFGPVILMGDSSGGALAASVAHALRGGAAQVAGVVLIYPGLGGPMDRGSYVTHANAPLLTTADVQFYRLLRHAGKAPPAGDVTAEVLQDTSFSRLPPTAIFSAECDPLADDGRAYRDHIRAAGGRAEWTCEPGLVHGYLRARHTVPRARDSFARIVASVAGLARGDLPAGDPVRQPAPDGA
ncbi:MAG: alpha/beta hydrolase [Rhodobacterales bacterium]|nr:alpha/beta hydrolase [Rhodobacterales bacterium]